MAEEKRKEKTENERENLKEFGEVKMEDRIHLISVIGEIEGHECLSANTKTTKYEHVLPQLAAIEDSDEIKGVLVLLNTVGGDVEAGLAIAEMLASLSKPTVSLVLGGSHSIGVPIAVSTDYSFIGHRDYGDSSRADERHRYRGAPDLRLFQTDAGSDPWLYRGSLQGKKRTA